MRCDDRYSIHVLSTLSLSLSSFLQAALLFFFSFQSTVLEHPQSPVFRLFQNQTRLLILGAERSSKRDTFPTVGLIGREA